MVITLTHLGSAYFLAAWSLLVVTITTIIRSNMALATRYEKVHGSWWDPAK